MQKINNLIYYSASDIVNFLECEHLTALDLINLETPLPQTEDDDEAILYQQKGIAHEGAYVDHLRHSVSCLVDVSGYMDNLRLPDVGRVFAGNFGNGDGTFFCKNGKDMA